MSSFAADDAAAPKKAEAQLEEIQVTGSRIVRRDLESNSPLVTVEKEKLEDNTFISVEEALNDLPQFMAGGVGMSAATVTSLQAANGLDNGRGSGDAFNSALLPDNAGVIGIVVPGAANVNLRGLGANRSLTLINGHRGMPNNASMTVDLNTIPTIAIGNVEVITGGASAVYGADALAGVTNIKLRDNFEGLSLRVRGGVNEVGDGAEYQVSGLMGAKIAGGRGNAMIGIEYSNREETLWKNRSFFRDVMASQYSGSGNYLFGSWEPYYSPGGDTSTGTFVFLQKAWAGNAPSLTAINGVFSDRNCLSSTGTPLNCITTATPGTLAPTSQPNGGGFYFNSDGTLFVRSSQTGLNTPGAVGLGAGSQYFGPQSYNGGLTSTSASPNEVVCGFQSAGVSKMSQFSDKPCNPTVGRTDYDKWLTGPRKAYTMFGSGSFEFNDHVTAFSNFNFASSNTVTRREPAPYLGPGFSVAIPFHTTQGGDAVYLPSVVTVGTAGAPVGSTKLEFRTGGTRGTSCPATGGCTMAQAFPVSPELRTLLESRPATATIGTTGANATNPFRGLSACNRYSLAVNPVAAGVRNNTANGNAAYLTEIDPNTGQFLATCGPNSGWLLNQQLTYFPPRGTENTERLFQFAAGLRGDVGLSDWTWEAYTSYGDAQTQTNYIGFSSMANYAKIMSQPNYGRGFSEVGTSSKYLTCTSGLNPFNAALKVSQDCLDAISADEIDRNSMLQRIYEFTTQGHVFDLPGGEVRAALGASYRRNDFKFTPDSLRAAAYTNDAAAGAFASGSVDEHVTVKEAYGELLVPLLKDLPLIKTLELELGARHSDYSTGQTVDTYKALASWAPVAWARARGGYNRAERAPNMSELFATPSGSAQFSAGANDPCRSDATQATVFQGATPGTTTNNLPQNPNRAQLVALCSAQINQWGGNNSSDFQVDPNNFLTIAGGALIVGNPNLKNERGDTWTMGLALSSPFQHPLLSRVSATFDWYEAVVTDPIEVQQTGQIVNSCYNVNGLNPTYSVDDPLGFCSLIERDPQTGGIARVYNQFGNQGKLVIRGVDFTMRWSAMLSDLGLESLPGTVGINISGNYLIDQIQRYGANLTDDYAGYGGASRIRSSTDLRYTWGRGNRVSLTWQYRQGTQTASGFATALSADAQNGPNLHRNPILAGYGTSNMFNGTVGTKIGPVSASLSINNLLNTKPQPGGYDLRDPLAGFGSFSPFDDLVGRRYSINLSMDF